MNHGSLNSDHVNYLILRYLQESGHENTARALYTDWHRSDEYSDPEALPFAAEVTQHQLIHIIQDGLFHDRLQASVNNDHPRFRLTETRPPPIPRARRRSLYTNNNDAHLDVATADDGALESAGKRLKKKGVKRNPALNVITNGDHDAMDVDSVNNLGMRRDADADADPDPDDPGSGSSSPQVPPEQQEASDNDNEDMLDDLPPIDVASHSTQTVNKAAFRTRTTYLTLDGPDRATIMHATWSPASSTSHRADHQSRLLVTGESVCRIYNFDEHGGIVSRTLTEMEDVAPMGHDTFISASSWHPSGQHITCATQSVPPSNPSKLAGGFQLVDHSLDGRSSYLDTPSSMSRDSVIVLMLRYSLSGHAKLVISTNGARSMLQIWHTVPSESNGPSPQPYVAQTFERVIMDAAWISENELAVCGDGELTIVSLAERQEDGTRALTRTPLDRSSDLANDDSHGADMWDKVRYDNVHEVLVCCCSVASRLRFFKRVNDGDTTTPTWSLVQNAPTQLSKGAGILTAMAFERCPSAVADEQTPRRMAAAFQSGMICIFEVDGSGCRQTATMTIGGQASALALAWAPTGGRLAVAGDEVIRIWDVAHAGGVTEPIWSWQVAPAKWYQKSDNHLPGDDNDDDEANPSLDWDATGQRLALALGKKMAIISIINSDEPMLVDGAQQML